VESNPNGGGPALTALASLRRFVRPRAARERCELCDAALADDHAHLVETTGRQLVCACDACAILFSGRAETKYRRVPRRVQLLPGFRMTEEAWDDLQLPINLAFFVHSTPAGRVVAMYPSPAGATESLVEPESWKRLEDENPSLCDLEPDVEALLVNRIREARECYRVGIDECYKLVGLIRTHWRGLSGGQAAWEEIGRFFVDLKRRESHA
jgi:hypothetical protein